ncbi:MAG: tetratricopeptide repeat protein [Spirochaetia bacterium]|jgi:tetratricopeptide (TPR) repeat protein|nr:tetratricopeptide repeat protein [Spirochaetia bacterium]
MQNNKPLLAPPRNTEQDLFNIEAFKRDADPLIEKAYDFIEEENYQKAFELFAFAASIDNENTEILNGLGITLCEMGRLTESLKILERAMRIDDKDPVTFANIAGVYWELEDYERALYYYQRAIDIDPYIEEAHYNIVNLYIDMNALYAALIRCTEFCAKFPKDPEGPELLSNIMLNLAISLY